LTQAPAREKGSSRWLLPFFRVRPAVARVGNCGAWHYAWHLVPFIARDHAEDHPAVCLFHCPMSQSKGLNRLEELVVVMSRLLLVIKPCQRTKGLQWCFWDSPLDANDKLRPPPPGKGPTGSPTHGAGKGKQRNLLIRFSVPRLTIEFRILLRQDKIGECTSLS
jgi:hypothetical protein